MNSTDAGDSPRKRGVLYLTVIVVLLALVVGPWFVVDRFGKDNVALIVIAALTTLGASYAFLFYVLPRLLVGVRLRTVLIPVPQDYSEGMGLKYARELATRAQGMSLVLMLTGWFLLTASVLLAITGSVAGSTRGNSTEVAQEEADVMRVVDAMWDHPGLLCSTLAVVFAALGWQCLDRSGSATRLASIANISIKKAGLDGDDREAYSACVEAKSSWLEGRMSTERVQALVNQLAQGGGPRIGGDTKSGAGKKQGKQKKPGKSEAS